MVTDRRTSRPRGRHSAGFTIVEVLATLTLAAIALPPTVDGILLCLASTGFARDHARAASLAQSKLAELVATGDIYDAEMEGDFGEDWPEYTWIAQSDTWDQDDRLRQVDLAVLWTRRATDHSVTVTTLVYTGRARE